MELWEQIRRQRVKHIISSYKLSGSDGSAFDVYLEQLLQTYPTPLIELALIETLVDHWTSIPLVRGLSFLTETHSKLQAWEKQPIFSTLTPDQFQQITGLDPSPIFGSVDVPACSSVQPS